MTMKTGTSQNGVAGNGRASMRFILATGGSTADNLVPLLVSEAYRTIRTGAVISAR